ncbi:MAG: ATP-binding protein [Patescibacteria group bacterium]|nr:MAG: ATP-binding protein [Patescibacteria group bacterium]
MLKSIVYKQKEDRDRLLTKSYIERLKGEKADQLIASDLIKVILGPRRAGKSVFALRLLKDKKFAYFNFDDEAFAGQERIDLDELLTELKVVYGDTKYLLFDEIQNLDKWELFVNRLHRLGYNLVITGSNAQLLSQELATHLTGRHIPIEIMPFCFKEMLIAKEYDYSTDKLFIPQEKADLLKHLNDFLINGGYPEVITKELEPRGYLDVLFDAVLFKDVVKRHKVRFSEQLNNLGSYLMNNFAGLYDMSKLAGFLDFKSKITLDNYLGYLKEAYLIFSLENYSAKARERIRAPRKIYVVDNGFITAKAVQHSPNNGKLLENLVFNEIVKKGKRPNLDLFYYKTKNGKEVDFLLKEGYKLKQLIQVTYDTSAKETEEREIKALIEAGQELGVKDLLVITYNEKREVKKQGKTVVFLPFWEWAYKTT